MPTYIRSRERPLTVEKRRQRRLKYGVSRYGLWFDPFPEVLGSRPEKMVFAEFMRLKIPFEFQTFVRFTIKDLNFDKWYRPDFVVPAAKIIIEVQGLFWHSTPKAIADDAFKQAIYQMRGYKVLTWWDFEIEAGVMSLIIREPRLLALVGRGTRIIPKKRQSNIDDLKGLRTLNQKKRRPYTRRPTQLKGKRQRRKPVRSYRVG